MTEPKAMTDERLEEIRRVVVHYEINQNNHPGWRQFHTHAIQRERELLDEIDRLRKENAELEERAKSLSEAIAMYGGGARNNEQWTELWYRHEKMLRHLESKP